MKKSSIILLMLSFLLCTCSSNEDQVNSEDKTIIQNVVENIIKPEEDKLYKDATDFQNLITAFTKETTLENHEKIKKQWLVVAKDWARCFAFNIGEVKEGNFFRYLARFPVNTESLENRIHKIPLEQLTPKRILSFGNDSKGIYGIEYLIFATDLAEFQKNEKRRKVLSLIVSELLNDLKKRQELWKQYAPKLIANKIPKDQAENSLTRIFGGIDNVIHFAWETKVGKAIRKNDIEARYSKKSLDLLKENLAITKKVYFEGGFAKKMKKTLKSDEWNQKIEKRYRKIEEILASFQTPLVEAVNNDEKSKVEELMREFKNLESFDFSKVEMVLNFVDGTKEGDGD